MCNLNGRMIDGEGSYCKKPCPKCNPLGGSHSGYIMTTDPDGDGKFYQICSDCDFKIGEDEPLPYDKYMDGSKYRYGKTTRIAICYDGDDDDCRNPKELPIGSEERIEIKPDLKLHQEVLTEVFCIYHKKWEWKGEAKHWIDNVVILDGEELKVQCPTCKEDGVVLFTEKEFVEKHGCCPDCRNFRRTDID